MKERPILFSAPMVRAILDGTKTQTRRIVKHPAAEGKSGWHPTTTGWQYLPGGSERPVCPYGRPGDRLWVRETHAPAADCWGAWERRMCMDSTGPAPIIHYQADGGDPFIERWRPSIHMPRWASRINLEITSVRVERLQDISEADAIAEGISKSDRTGGWLPGNCAAPEWAYRELWEQINGAGSWEANPWVWVVEFRRIEAVKQAA